MENFDVREAKSANFESSPVAAKRAYSAPKLTTYGTVSALTMSGNGSGLDGGVQVGMTMVSDPAAKENIVEVGRHPLGFGLYLFDYKCKFRDDCGHGRQFGVMADEVDRVLPDAVVVREDGYKAVNYAMLGISFH